MFSMSKETKAALSLEKTMLHTNFDQSLTQYNQIKLTVERGILYNTHFFSHCMLTLYDTNPDLISYITWRSDAVCSFNTGPHITKSLPAEWRKTRTIIIYLQDTCVHKLNLRNYKA